MKPFTYQSIIYRGEEFTGVETIQIDIENNLHLFLEKNSEKISLIIIVGAWRGDEINSFLKYTRATIICFEPNPENFAILQDRFQGEGRVTCLPYACGPRNGKAELHEADVTGNDSLLEINESGRKSFKQKKTHTIEMRKLDDIDLMQGKEVDLLWMDVQGYEKNVLLGAEETLKRTTSVFLEVTTGNGDYKGSATYAELTSSLIASGFHPIADGFDERGVDGNAFFSRKKVGRIFLESFQERIRQKLFRRYIKRKVGGAHIYTRLAQHVPMSTKMHIKKILGI